MIRSFGDRETDSVFNRRHSRRLPPALQKIAYRKLLMLHAATTVNDLRSPPGNRLERLVGARDGQYSIRINDQYRICFEWDAGHAYNVEIVDYH